MGFSIIAKSKLKERTHAFPMTPLEGRHKLLKYRTSSWIRHCCQKEKHTLPLNTVQMSVTKNQNQTHINRTF